MKTPNTMFHRTVVFAAFGVAAVSAFAQPTPARSADNQGEEVVSLSTFEVNAATNRGYIATNSVSATRTNIKTIELPFTVNVVTSELISDLGAINLDDALRFAGVGAQRGTDVNNGRVITRGFTTNDVKRNGFVLRAQGVLNSAYIDR